MPIIYLCRPADLVYLVFGLVSGHAVPSSGLVCGLASGLGHHVLNLVRREGACLQYPNFDGLSNTLYHANLSNSYENHDEVFDDNPTYDLPTYAFCNYLSNEDILLHTKTEHLDKCPSQNHKPVSDTSHPAMAATTNHHRRRGQVLF